MSRRTSSEGGHALESWGEVPSQKNVRLIAVDMTSEGLHQTRRHGIQGFDRLSK